MLNDRGEKHYAEYRRLVLLKGHTSPPKYFNQRIRKFCESLKNVFNAVPMIGLRDRLPGSRIILYSNHDVLFFKEYLPDFTTLPFKLDISTFQNSKFKK